MPINFVTASGLRAQNDPRTQAQISDNSYKYSKSATFINSGTDEGDTPEITGSHVANTQDAW